EFGPPNSAARAQLIVADILLDLAVQDPMESAQHFKARFAHPLIVEGARLAAESGDPVGGVGADLTEARWSRLVGQNVDRIALIERAMRLGHEWEDEAVLAQAFTTLGDELVSQGRPEAGVYRYRDVSGLLDGSEAPALGVWALRALLRQEEFAS